MTLTLFLSTAICVVFILQIYRFFRERSKRLELLDKLPGPKPLPLVGNLFEFMNSQEEMFLNDRKRSLQYYPIYKIRLFDIAAITVLHPEDIELLVTNMKHITKGHAYDFLHSWLGTGLLTSTNEKWQSRRKLLTPTFHFNILQEFLKIFNEETKKLTENLEKRSNEAIDVLPAITYFALNSIAETAMGLKLDERAEKESYKNAIYKLGELLTYRVQRPWLYNDVIYNLTKAGKENVKLLKSLHKLTSDVIEERQKSFSVGSYSERKRLAMLDLLLKYRSEGANIDDEGIREEVDTFMFEGHDTTAMALCFTLMLIANHRKIQDEIVEEIESVVIDSKSQSPSFNDLQELKFMERVIKESLRLYPSVPFIERIIGEDMKTTTGYLIPKGSSVNIHIYDLHHNPNVFPDPEKFDPDRFLPENVQKRHPFAYIPFSAGARNCIGQKFAMLEMKAVLCGILMKFALEPVTKPEDVEFITDMVLRSKNSIYVKFVPRTRNK